MRGGRYGNKMSKADLLQQTYRKCIWGSTSTWEMLRGRIIGWSVVGLSELGSLSRAVKPEDGSRSERRDAT